MPWKITAAPSGGFYVVDTEGKRMSGVPHKTRAKAARQLRALYASEKEHTGVMVALFLPLEVAQSLPGESPEDMHITLAYLGDMDSVDLGKLSAAVGMVASESSPIHGKVGGIGRFTDTGSPEGDAVYLSYDSPDLPAFRERLVECLASHGVPVMSEHGFTPHITLRYIDPLESMPDVRAENVPIDFDTVTIAYGDTRIPFKLSTAIKEVSTTPNAVTAHGGPGGLLSAPGLAETIAEVVITPKRKRKKRTKEWLIEQFKHLSGEHNQKRHGWRFSGLGATRRAMGAGVSDDVKGKIDPKAERDAYRKRAGMTEIKKVEKKPDEASGAKAAYGENTTAFGTSPGKRYEFRTVVKNLDDLITSNTLEGGVNPKYTTELQPRMRSRQASKDQIEGIAKNLDPDEILTDFHILEKGPMIIGADNMVESGNGRTMALKLAKEAYPEKWAEYQKALKSKLTEAGIDPNEAAKVQNAVLVRERISQVDRAEFAREANQPPVLGMSPLEVATIDASRVTPAMIQNLKVGDDQSIDVALRSTSNSDFVRKFVSALPANERATILRADGSLNRMGLWRIKAAIFSRVFPGEAGQRLADTFLESLDGNIKNFENALSSALPKLAQAEGLMQAGRRNKSLSMADDFTKAIDMLARLKESGTKVSDYLSQGSMFGSELNKRQRTLLNAFEGMSRKPSEIKGFLTRYADSIINSAASGQGAFSGMNTTLNNLDDLMKVLLPEAASIPTPISMFG